MRKIKFRAWDRVNNAMNTEPTAVYFHDDSPTEVYPCANDSEWILLQFTGLKDANGKEIYEGDILRVSVFVSQSHLTYVNFDMELGCWHRAADYSSGEIIGNIYENADLLK